MIMRNLFLLCLFIIAFPVTLKAQGAKLGLNAIGTKEIDAGAIRIYYNYHRIDSTLHLEETYDIYDIQCLEIGNRLSKYYSYAVFHNDSISKVWLINNPTAHNPPYGWMSDIIHGSSGWSEYKWSVSFKDFSTNQLTEYTKMAVGIAVDYWYSENIPTQNWDIYDDTMTIVGYFCQKATCHFRGRDFTAWFTPEIPINNGPWKFGGLPGLIMKVYDKDEIFIYECVKIEQKDYKIYTPDFSKYKKIDRINLLKLNKDIHEDWYKTANMINFETRAPSSSKSKYKYRPLELE